MQKSFVFNLDHCDGCHACQIACVIENQFQPSDSWRFIITFNEKRFPDIPVIHYSLACNHCLEAPCLKFCPSLAFERNVDFGAVIINTEKCIGCKYCSWQCPYDALKYNKSKGIMQKCTLCINRLEEGKEPACVISCPLRALSIAEYSEIENEQNLDNFLDIGIKPALKINKVKYFKSRPEISSENNNPNVKKYLKEFIIKGFDLSALKSEIPLVIFTYLVTIIVSLFTSSLLTKTQYPIFIFYCMILLSLGIGIFHLGKKTRSYRIILNWRNSWLSREIIFLGLFIISSLFFLFFFPNIIFLCELSIGLGFAILFSVDRIYETKSRVKTFKMHSAETVLTGLFLIGVFTNNKYLFGFFGIIKLILYIYRKLNINKIENNFELLLSFARIFIGLIIPLIIWFINHENFSLLTIVLVVIGELIDRIEFYHELEFISPQKFFEDKLLK